MAKFLIGFCKWLIIFLFIVFLGLVGILCYYYRDLPGLDELSLKNSENIIEINYNDGKRIRTFGDSFDNQITYDQIPKHLIEAVIATEDRKFFDHHGVDFLAIIRAAYVNYNSGKVVQGASTITQQLAKLMFLKPEKTAKRKIQEILLARQLEQNFSKEQILTMYLNRAYFGAGNYGVAAASQYYFKKSVAKINLNESAMLAGILKAPSKLAPTKNYNLSKNRAYQVLSNMIDAGYLDKNGFDQLDQEIHYQTDKLQRFYFADFVFDQYPEYLSKQNLQNKQLTIETSLDERIQNLSEDIVDDFVVENKERLAESQIAIIIMAKDGAILGMIGGKDYYQSQFNRAVYSKRQIGSAFKTFLYLAALENGFQTDDVFEDKKISFGKWEPENYQKKYYGQVSLKQAFAYSLNSVSVQIAQDIDRHKIVEVARKLGIISKIDQNDPTIALGTNQVNLLELVGAYASIANDGYAVIPYAIKTIETSDQLLYQRQSSGLGQVIKPEDLAKLKEILHEVVISGTGKAANVANNNIYGKTGTSQNHRDAWFVGFNDDYVIGIWIGNDDNSPTNYITGGSLPAQLFAKIIKKIS